MLHVIAFTGKAQSGKSESQKALADILVTMSDTNLFIKQNQKAINVIPVSFATKVKKVAADLFGWDGDKELYYPMTGDINKPIKNKGRQVLIEVGSAGRAIDKDIWVKHAVNYASQFINEGYEHTFIVIDDLRFLNEIEYLDKVFANVKVIKIERKSQLDIDDPSEKDLDDYDGFDAIITNNGTKEQLRDRLNEYLQSLKLEA